METENEYEAPVNTALILGTCQVCKIGNIKYYSTNSVGVRFCDNCGISTFKGDVVSTQREASQWK